MFSGLSLLSFFLILLQFKSQLLYGDCKNVKKTSRIQSHPKLFNLKSKTVSFSKMEYEDPFTEFNISNKWKLLSDINNRTACSNCSKSRKYFCYTCYIPVPRVKEIIPKVSLPIKIDILKHRGEIDGKSTSAHAILLAPDQVSIIPYPGTIPDYPRDGRTVLIYPSQNSVTLEKYFQMNPVIVSSRNDTTICDKLGTVFVNGKTLELPFDRAVFVDGTWSQSKPMFHSLEGLPCIVLQSRLSQYWRHQKKSPRWYLATIEAIHQFLLELSHHCSELVGVSSTDKKCSDYDNLLFFFRHMYHVIHSLYDHDLLMSYSRPRNL